MPNTPCRVYVVCLQKLSREPDALLAEYFVWFVWTLAGIKIERYVSIRFDFFSFFYKSLNENKFSNVTKMQAIFFFSFWISFYPF